MPKITHGHVVPVLPLAGKGLFGASAWTEGAGLKEDGTFEVVVYNSLTVDPSCESPR